jgi:hypothetical protein
MSRLRKVAGERGLHEAPEMSENSRLRESQR